MQREGENAYLRWGHQLFGLGPLGCFGQGVVVVDATVCVTRFAPESWHSRVAIDSVGTIHDGRTSWSTSWFGWC